MHTLFHHAVAKGRVERDHCSNMKDLVNTGKAFFRIRMDMQGYRTLGETLWANGYMTFATGKWHNQEPAWLRSFQKGENIMFGGMSDHTKVPVRRSGAAELAGAE